MNTPQDALNEASRLFRRLVSKKTPTSREEALSILKRVKHVCAVLSLHGYHSTAHALSEAYSSDVVFMGFALNVTIH